nr:polyprotein [Binucleate Rhizoctonia hypovirus 1]
MSFVISVTSILLCIGQAAAWGIVKFDMHICGIPLEQFTRFGDSEEAIEALTQEQVSEPEDKASGDTLANCGSIPEETTEEKVDPQQLLIVLANLVQIDVDNGREEDEALEIAAQAFETFASTQQDPIPEEVKYFDDTYNYIRSKIMKYLARVSLPPASMEILTFLIDRAERSYTLWRPLLQALYVVIQTAYQTSAFVAQKLNFYVRRLIHFWWPDLKTRRDSKAVWLPQGFTPELDLNPFTRWGLEIGMVTANERTSFEQDYQFYVDMVTRYAKEEGVRPEFVEKIGGVNLRRTSRSKPVMSSMEAEAIGFTPDEYEHVNAWEAHVHRLTTKYGIPQASDAFWRSYKNPEEIFESARRYEPKQHLMTDYTKKLADDIVTTITTRFAETFLDKSLVHPDAFRRYIERSSVGGTAMGVGFMHPSINTKEKAKATGLTKALVSMTLDNLRNGKYPGQFYHINTKEQQVQVNLEKAVRTVSAQNVASSYHDAATSIDNSKTTAVDSIGMLGGVPLNFKLRKVWNALLEHAHGDGTQPKGGYIMKDAHAYDSTIPEIGSYIASRVRAEGFRWHPKAKEIESHINAKAHAITHAWMTAVTINPETVRPFAVVDEATRDRLIADSPSLFSSNFEANKLTLRLDKSDTKGHNYVGTYLTKDIHGDDFTHKYTDAGGKIEEELVDHHLYKLSGLTTHLNHVIAKNRGGGTGSMDTTWWNSVTYIATCCAAYCLAFNKTPEDYFTDVRMFNMGDDSAEATKKVWTRHERMAFKAAALALGVDLDVEFTRDITEVRLLSMGIRFLKPHSRGSIHSEDTDFSPHAHDWFVYNKWLGWVKNIEVKDEFGQIIKAKGEDVDIQDLNPKYMKGHATHAAFIVFNSGTQAIMRQTAFKAFRAGLNQWSSSVIDGAVGLSNLFAFQPFHYHIAAETYRVGCREKAIELGLPIDVQITRDNEGLPIVRIVPLGASGEAKFNTQKEHVALLTSTLGVDAVALTEREFLRRMKEKGIEPSNRGSRSLRQTHFLQRITKGSLKFPSYKKVVLAWMCIDAHHDKTFGNSKWQKFMNKYRAGAPWDQQTMAIIGVMNEFTLWVCPDPMYRFLPPLPGKSNNLSWRVKDDPLAQSLAVIHQTRVPKELDSLARESPFSDCMDPSTWALTMGEDDEHWAAINAQPVQFHKARFLVVSLWYIYISMLLEPLVMTTPGLNVLYFVFCFYSFKLPKWYSLGNFLYWLGTGRSSLEISSLIPRDPWMWFKRMATFLAFTFFGDYFAVLLMPVIFVIEQWAPFVETMFRLFRQGQLQRDFGSDMKENPWDPHARPILKMLNEHGQGMVTSGTGSGKSTYLQAALIAYEHEFNSTGIVICQPRNILAEQLKIPFSITQQLVREGTQWDTTARVHIGTYGHLSTRFEKIPDDTLMVFDEFHEMDGYMIFLWSTILKYRVRTGKPTAYPTMFLSATPKPLPGIKDYPIYDPKLVSRAKREVIIRDAPDAIDNYIWAAKQYPELATSALIVVPRYEDVGIFCRRLAELGRSSAPCHRNARNPDPSVDVIVATTIVNAGITLPSRDLLISTGKRLATDEGVFQYPMPDTDPQFETQLDGRVGRGTRTGVIVKTSNAGKGKAPIEYPSGSLFADDLVAEYFRVPQLQTLKDSYLKLLPVFRVLTRAPNGDKLSDQIRKGLAAIHVLNLMGVPENSRGEEINWRQAYKTLSSGGQLPAEYRFVHRCLNEKVAIGMPSFELISCYIRAPVVEYEYIVKGKTVKDIRGPIIPLKKGWEITVPMGVTITRHEYAGDAQEYERLLEEKQKEFDRILKTKQSALDVIGREIKNAARGGRRRTTPEETLRRLREIITANEDLSKMCKNNPNSSPPITVETVTVPRTTMENDAITACILKLVQFRVETMGSTDQKTITNHMTSLEASGGVGDRVTPSGSGTVACSASFRSNADRGYQWSLYDPVNTTHIYRIRKVQDVEDFVRRAGAKGLVPSNSGLPDGRSTFQSRVMNEFQTISNRTQEPDKEPCNEPIIQILRTVHSNPLRNTVSTRRSKNIDDAKPKNSSKYKNVLLGTAIREPDGRQKQCITPEHEQISGQRIPAILPKSIYKNHDNPKFAEVAVTQPRKPNKDTQFSEETGVRGVVAWYGENTKSCFPEPFLKRAEISNPRWCRWYPTKLTHWSLSERRLAKAVQNLKGWIIVLMGSCDQERPSWHAMVVSGMKSAKAIAQTQQISVTMGWTSSHGIVGLLNWNFGANTVVRYGCLRDSSRKGNNILFLRNTEPVHEYWVLANCGPSTVFAKEPVTLFLGLYTKHYPVEDNCGTSIHLVSLGVAKKSFGKSPEVAGNQPMKPAKDTYNHMQTGSRGVVAWYRENTKHFQSQAPSVGLMTGDHWEPHWHAVVVSAQAQRQQQTFESALSWSSPLSGSAVPGNTNWLKFLSHYDITQIFSLEKRPCHSFGNTTERDLSTIGGSIQAWATIQLRVTPTNKLLMPSRNRLSTNPKGFSDLYDMLKNISKHKNPMIKGFSFLASFLASMITRCPSPSRADFISHTGVYFSRFGYRYKRNYTFHQAIFSGSHAGYYPVLVFINLFVAVGFVGIDGTAAWTLLELSIMFLKAKYCNQVLDHHYPPFPPRPHARFAVCVFSPPSRSLATKSKGSKVSIWCKEESIKVKYCRFIVRY